MPQQIEDSNFKLCEYANPRRGAHGVVGNAVFDRQYVDNMIKNGNGWQMNYGYHTSGERFLVHVADINLNPRWFVPVQQAPADQVVLRLPQHSPPVVTKAPVELGELLEVGEPLAEQEPKFDFQILPGVTGEMSDGLNEFGAKSLEDLLTLGNSITSVKGIGKVRADAILASAREKLDELAAMPSEGEDGEKAVSDALEELENLLA